MRNSKLNLGISESWKTLSLTWDLLSFSSHDPEKVIINFSCYGFSSSDKDLLSKGLRFAFPHEQINY